MGYQHVFKVTPRIMTEEVSQRMAWKTRAVEENPCCCYCNGFVGIGAEYGWMQATVDHVQPLSRGGRDVIENYALACRACNESKGSGVFTSQKRSALLRRNPSPSTDHLRRKAGRGI